jgi:hypothetical protein
VKVVVDANVLAAAMFRIRAAASEGRGGSGQVPSLLAEQRGDGT